MNYTEIVNAAIAYADRQDIEVANNIDTFLLLVEARINRLLKTREQTHRIYSPTIDGVEYYPLPPDYAGMRDIQINSDLPHNEHSSSPMVYLSPSEFNIKRNGTYDGVAYYCVVANQIQIFPILSSGLSIEMVFYRRVPSLMTTAPTNWLADTHPDIYISGLISEIESFTKNYEVAKGWDMKVTRSVEELENSDVEERWGGSSLTMRVAQ